MTRILKARILLALTKKKKKNRYRLRCIMVTLGTGGRVVGLRVMMQEYTGLMNGHRMYSNAILLTRREIWEMFGISGLQDGDTTYVTVKKLV